MLEDELNRISLKLAAEQSLKMLEHEEDEDNDICATTTVTKIEAAIDSGSVDNVMHPDEVPGGVEITSNKGGKHFVGANNARIENYGRCQTSIRAKTDKGVVDGEGWWTLADVTRPLHSVSKMCGPKDEPRQDALFNSKKCVVVPPGIVDKILQHIDPLLQYDRQGGLYVTEMELSPFRRQGAKA